MQEPIAQGRDTSYKTAELVNLISELGPDIPEISRRLGQFKESVRYRYKEKVLGRGFAIHALPNHERLGLQRVVVLADFAPMYAEFAHSILTAMNELCYVVSFEKRMFRGDYFVEASVPTEFLDEFAKLMFALKDKGLFSSMEIIPFDWFRNIPMRTAHYDFDTGRWDFDWSAQQPTLEGAAYRPSAKTKFDRDDLLILKEMQIDATRSFTEISSKLKENYKKLAWHYNSHVLERGLINGYALRWMGTSYSTLLEKALHRKHRYQQLVVLATNLTEMERMSLMASAYKVPFLWSEMVGTDAYCANFFFPTEYITEAYQFLTTAISGIKDKVTVIALDQTEALSFTISYQLFDGKAKKWTLDLPRLLSQFDNLIAKIVEIGGSV